MLIVTNPTESKVVKTEKKYKYGSCCLPCMIEIRKTPNGFICHKLSKYKNGKNKMVALKAKANPLFLF